MDQHNDREKDFSHRRFEERSFMLQTLFLPFLQFWWTIDCESVVIAMVEVMGHRNGPRVIDFSRWSIVLGKFSVCNGLAMGHQNGPPGASGP